MELAMNNRGELECWDISILPENMYRVDPVRIPSPETLKLCRQGNGSFQVPRCNGAAQQQ